MFATTHSAARGIRDHPCIVQIRFDYADVGPGAGLEAAQARCRVWGAGNFES